MNKILSEMVDAGIRTLLGKMTLEDLFALTFTTTKGFVKPENREDAIQAIIMYSEDPSILLRRKKIKRELLFQYLYESGVQVSVNGDKRDFIDACLRFWGSVDAIREEFESKPLARPGLRENDVKPNIVGENNVKPNIAEENNVKPNIARENNDKPNIAGENVAQPQVQANHNPVPQECQPSHEMNNLNPIVTHPNPQPVPPHFVQQIVQVPNIEQHNQVPFFHQEHQRAPVQITEIIEEPNNNDVVPFFQNHPQEPVNVTPSNTNTYNMTSQTTNENQPVQFPSTFGEFNEYSIVVTQSPAKEEISELGTCFVEWFYKTLNGDSPNFPNHSFVPESFWPDCTIEVYTEGNDRNSKSACIQGASNILLFFKSVLNGNRLYVVPAMESIQTNYNSHGVVKITVNGIMHQIPNAAGLFEQVFLLIRDPVANEVWRIKNTMLRMRLNCPLQDFLQCQQTLMNMIFN